MSDDILDDIEHEVKPEISLFKKIMNISFRVIFVILGFGLLLGIIDYPVLSNYLINASIVLGITWMLLEGYRLLFKKK